GDGEAATRRLWRETGVKAMPGAYLSHGEGDASPGARYIRLAMVHDVETTEDALARLAGCL
ncbi:MAG: aspartate aminotransferase, partial [Alphaproteobacteria bacterium]|nr:aspartate aminotransferase [Alphaproteobacteria bacterium]